MIVGASTAGLTAAETLRRLGFTGAISLIGDEVLHPYDRTPLSKQFLAGQWALGRLYLRDAEAIERLGIDLHLGSRAVGVRRDDREVLLQDGRSFAYDVLVIATGVRPRRLASLPEHAGVHVMRTVEDARRLQARLASGRRLVIIGAGFLGGEVAGIARVLGARVTIVEAGPVPLADAVGHRIGAMVASLHEERGVRLRTGVGAVGVATSEGEITGVILTDGSVEPAQDVLVAIGAEPNTEWLSGSGLAVENGVVADQYLRAAPDVYAVGDVVRWHNPVFGTAMRIEHRTNAAEQGMAAARNILSPREPRPFAAVPYFWSDQHEVRLQAYGYFRGHDEVRVVDGSVEDRQFLVAYRAGSRLVGVLGAGVPPKDWAKWRAQLQAQALWTNVVGDILTP